MMNQSSTHHSLHWQHQDQQVRSGILQESHPPRRSRSPIETSCRAAAWVESSLSQNSKQLQPKDFRPLGRQRSDVKDTL